MAEFDNEEITRLKQWWDANGTALVIGVVLGLIVLGAWQGWHWYGEHKTEAAADIYQQAQPALAGDKVNDAVLKVVQQLKDDYASTPYATDAALNLAAYDVRQKDYDKAVKQLDWVIDNADSEGMRHVARVRKARLVWTQGDAVAALELLDVKHPQAFDSLYAELAGDIHAAQGDRKAAYKSYQLALESLPPDTPRQPLENKLADNAPDDGDAGTPSDHNTSPAS